MKLLILMALTAALAMGERPVRVGVAVEYPAEMGARVRAEFERETGRAMAAAGVALVWGARAGEVYDRMVVVRFRESCQGRALGLTHVSDGRVLPFVELGCGRVRASGRALARIAAHEMHHVLTASTDHDEEGLTKAEFTRADLWGSELKFAPAAVARIRARLQQGGGGEQSAGAEE